MDIDDLKKFYNVTTYEELGKIVSRTKGAIAHWKKNGIPTQMQEVLEARTNGKLKADKKISDSGEKNET